MMSLSSKESAVMKIFASAMEGNASLILPSIRFLREAGIIQSKWIWNSHTLSSSSATIFSSRPPDKWSLSWMPACASSTLNCSFPFTDNTPVKARKSMIYALKISILIVCFKIFQNLADFHFNRFFALTCLYFHSAILDAAADDDPVRQPDQIGISEFDAGAFFSIIIEHPVFTDRKSTRL